MSDHKDTVASACILSKCQVWTLKEYRVRCILKSMHIPLPSIALSANTSHPAPTPRPPFPAQELEIVTSTDFYWRYTYHTATRRFSPEEVPVYCSCNLPENPDIMMAECDACLRWFHPFPCEGVDPSEVQATGKFMCRGCRQQAATRAAALGDMGTGLPLTSAGAPGTITGAQLQAWANGASMESSGADALTTTGLRGGLVPLPP